MSEIEGGAFISGFASGAVSSLVGSAFSSTGNTTLSNGSKFSSTTSFKAMMIAAGGVAGGISSTIAGGDFWSGMKQGIITAGLNHAMHQMVSSKAEVVESNANDCDTCDGFWDRITNYAKKIGLFFYEMDPEGQSFDNHMQFALDEGASLRESGQHAFVMTKAENGGLNFIAPRGKSKIKVATKTSTKLLSQFNSAESLILGAGNLTKVKAGMQGFVKGDGASIFKTISQGGTRQANGTILMQDGTTLFNHFSTKIGVYTIDINKAGQIYKIRVTS